MHRRLTGDGSSELFLGSPFRVLCTQHEARDSPTSTGPDILASEQHVKHVGQTTASLGKAYVLSFVQACS